MIVCTVNKATLTDTAVWKIPVSFTQECGRTNRLHKKRGTAGVGVVGVCINIVAHLVFLTKSKIDVKYLHFFFCRLKIK